MFVYKLCVIDQMKEGQCFVGHFEIICLLVHWSNLFSELVRLGQRERHFSPIGVIGSSDGINASIVPFPGLCRVPCHAQGTPLTIQVE